MQDEQLIEAIYSTLQEVRPKLLEEFGNAKFKQKLDKSLVTELDSFTEEKLKARLAQLTPDHSVIGEEAGGKSSSKYWLIDPIDGTNAFVRGLPECTTLIARVTDGKVDLGIIYDFIADTFYHAIRGKGAFNGKKQLNVSERPFEFAYISLETKDNSYYNSLRSVISDQSIHFPEGSGNKWVNLAEGKIEAAIYKDAWAKPWDVAAGSLIAEEAGAIVRNLNSDAYDVNNTDLIAANPKVYEHLKSLKLA